MRALCMGLLLLVGCNEILSVDPGHCGTCAESLDECKAGYCPTDAMVCNAEFEQFMTTADCGCYPCKDTGFCTMANCIGEEPMSDGCKSCFIDHLAQFCAAETAACQ